MTTLVRSKPQSSRGASFSCAWGYSYRRLLPDANQPSAVARERLSVPSRPALAWAKPRQLGHEVKVGRPHVAERRRVAPDAALLEVEEVGPKSLVRDVVFVEPDPALGHLDWPEGLARRQPTEIG